MNTKIKRKLKTYNDRFREMGFIMSVNVNSDLSSDIDFMVQLNQDTEIIY